MFSYKNAQASSLLGHNIPGPSLPFFYAVVPLFVTPCKVALLLAVSTV
jgi:hypothetical protein